MESNPQGKQIGMAHGSRPGISPKIFLIYMTFPRDTSEGLEINSGRHYNMSLGDVYTQSHIAHVTDIQEHHIANGDVALL